MTERLAAWSSPRMAHPLRSSERPDHEALVDVVLWLRQHRVPEHEMSAMVRRVFRTITLLLPRRDPKTPLRPWMKAITDRHCARSARRRPMSSARASIPPGFGERSPALRIAV